MAEALVGEFIPRNRTRSMTSIRRRAGPVNAIHQDRAGDEEVSLEWDDHANVVADRMDRLGTGNRPIAGTRATRSSRLAAPITTAITTIGTKAASWFTVTVRSPSTRAATAARAARAGRERFQFGGRVDIRSRPLSARKRRRVRSQQCRPLITAVGEQMATHLSVASECLSKGVTSRDGRARVTICVRGHGRSQLERSRLGTV